MVHSSKTINRNFLIKASGIDGEGKRINKLVGVAGLLEQHRSADALGVGGANPPPRTK